MSIQNAKRDQNYVTTLLGVDISDLTTPTLVGVDAVTNRLLVSAIITGGGSSGTQYTDGDATVTHPVGTIPVYDKAGTITAVSVANPLPVSATISTAGLATSAKQDTGNTSLASIDTKLTNPLPVSLTSTTITGTVAAAQSGTWNIGTLTSITNTVTIAGAVTEATLDAALISQEATTSGIKGLTAFGAVTTNAPSYSTTKSDALSLDTSGLLRISLKDTPANTNKFLVTPDSVALPANQSVNISQINGVTPLMGNGTTGTGSQRVTIASDNTAFTVNAAQSGTWNVGGASTGSAVPSTAFYQGNQDGSGNLVGLKAWTHGINTAVALGARVLLGEFDDTSPTGTTENQAATLRISSNRNLYNTIRDAAGNERGANVTAGNALVVDGSAATQPVSGTVTGNQGTAGSTEWLIGGGVASGATDSGNPVKIGGRFNTTAPTVTDGQRVDWQMSNRGDGKIVHRDSSVAQADTVSNTANTLVNSTGTTLKLHTRPEVYNGTTWDRIPGDTTGIKIQDGGNSITVDATNLSTNMAQFGGNTVSSGVGTSGTGTQRVVLANDAGKTLVSASGSASSSGNNTIVSAGTNKLKVYAFTLSTLSTASVTVKFQSGAGGTDLWSVVLQAITGSSTGANLVVQPPAWLFATASATLLNLNLSSANAVQWSVSYFDEA